MQGSIEDTPGVGATQKERDNGGAVAAVVIILLLLLAVGGVCMHQGRLKNQAMLRAAAEGGETVEMVRNPLAAGLGGGAATVQNPTFQGPGAVVYTEPVAGQADIYDAEAARARAVSVEQRSSLTGASIVYAVPFEVRNDVYVDDGFYTAAGAPVLPGAPVASGDGNYVDDGFYASAGSAVGAGGARSSAEPVYAVPLEVTDTEA